MSKVFFNYDDRVLSINHKRKIRSFIASLFSLEKKELLRIDYIFCSDDNLLKINRSFLKHDFYTDIITFDLSEPKTGIKGEVYISVDRVKENAVALKMGFEEEILRVLFHGALHLCGYTDKRTKNILVMRQKEDHYIKLYKNHIKRST
ncbi:MAG TPA: rRNA maturation RNase YbeY [Chitinophagaceae bacterium]|nr:rRNA maturation RNase YbeY [Chitinophagaceae bacterium]